MASSWYNAGALALATGNIDWENDDIRVLLTTATYTPDKDSHVNVDDVTNELNGTGYARVALANKDATQDNANDRVDFEADNVTWTEIDAGTPAIAVIYKHVNDDTDSLLIGWVEFTPTTTNGGDFTLKWNNGATAGAVLRATTTVA